MNADRIRIIYRTGMGDKLPTLKHILHLKVTPAINHRADSKPVLTRASVCSAQLNIP